MMPPHAPPRRRAGARLLAGRPTAMRLAAALLPLVSLARGALPAPWDFYHTTEEIQAEFAQMARDYPLIMKWQPERDKGTPGFGGEKGGHVVDIATITDFTVPDAGGAWQKLLGTSQGGVEKHGLAQSVEGILSIFCRALGAGKARVLLVFGEHAREIITSELALW